MEQLMDDTEASHDFKTGVKIIRGKRKEEVMEIAKCFHDPQIEPEKAMDILTLIMIILNTVKSPLLSL